jgi:hypothetical protein
LPAFVIGAVAIWIVFLIPWALDLFRFLRDRPSPAEEDARLLEASKRYAEEQTAFWSSRHGRRIVGLMLGAYGLAGGDAAPAQLLSRHLDRDSKQRDECRKDGD